MRLGVFGGSFDPVHVGHLIAAESAAEQLSLDRLLVVPTAQQSLKTGPHEAEAGHRARMVELAIAGNPRFQIDRRELDRGGVSYTVDTLRELRVDFPTNELFLLVGADMAGTLDLWRDLPGITGLATIVAMTRPGTPAPDHPAVGRTIAVPAVDVSATAIRAAVRSGRSIRYLVPDAVVDYIREQRLYTH